MKTLLTALLMLFSVPVFALTLTEEYEELSPQMEILKRGDITAVRHLEPFVQSGNSVALVLMGTFYEEGSGVEKSPQKAVEYFQKAADKGNQMGQVYLADMYLKGNGVEQNIQKAKELYALSSEGSDPTLTIDALKKLAQIQEIELSITVSKLYQAAALEGDSLAMLTIANKCYEGKDYVCAYSWYGTAALLPEFQSSDKVEKITKLLDLIKGQMTLEEITKAEKQIEELKKIVKIPAPVQEQNIQSEQQTDAQKEAPLKEETILVEKKFEAPVVKSNKIVPNNDVIEETPKCQKDKDIRTGCYLDIENATTERLGKTFFEEAAALTGAEERAIELGNVDYAAVSIPKGSVARIFIPAKRIPPVEEVKKVSEQK